MRSDLKRCNKKYPIITFNNGIELKINTKELFDALRSIGTVNEHRIVKAMRGKEVLGYTGEATCLN